MEYSYSKTFKFITGQDTKYYKHTLFGWSETKETKSKWYDILSSKYSEADSRLVICRKLDFVKDTLPKLVFAGAVLSGGFLAITVIDTTLDYAAIVGFKSTIQMLTSGGITGMNTVMETYNSWQRIQQILIDGSGNIYDESIPGTNWDRYVDAEARTFEQRR